MIFSQLPEFAQIKACELLSSKYFHCTNENERVTLANDIQKAFISLYSQEATPAIRRHTYSEGGAHSMDAVYHISAGVHVDIDKLHQAVTTALCSSSEVGFSPEIKTILIFEEQTKVIRGKLSDDQLIDWLQKLISEIEISRQVPEGIQRNERMLNEKRELLTRNKDYLNNAII